MEPKLRISIVALIPETADANTLQQLAVDIANGVSGHDYNAITKVEDLPDGRRRSYIKLSKVIDESELKKNWQFDITQKFFEAGYPDIAWKFTRVDPNEFNPEETTETFPDELFGE